MQPIDSALEEVSIPRNCLLSLKGIPTTTQAHPLTHRPTLHNTCHPKQDFAPLARLGDPKMEVGTGEKTHEAVTTVKPSPSADGQILSCAIHTVKHYLVINRSTDNAYDTHKHIHWSKNWWSVLEPPGGRASRVGNQTTKASLGWPQPFPLSSPPSCPNHGHSLGW